MWENNTFLFGNLKKRKKYERDIRRVVEGVEKRNVDRFGYTRKNFWPRIIVLILAEVTQNLEWFCRFHIL